MVMRRMITIIRVIIRNVFYLRFFVQKKINQAIYAVQFVPCSLWNIQLLSNTRTCIRTIVVNKQGRDVFARYPTVVVGAVAVLQLLKAFLDNVV